MMVNNLVVGVVIFIEWFIWLGLVLIMVIVIMFFFGCIFGVCVWIDCLVFFVFILNS